MNEYQRVWAEINLDNLRSNLAQVKKRVGDRSVMAIVKADAYGHGAEVVSRVLLEEGCKCLGVAICDEALALRESVITAPILILSYTPTPRLKEVIENNLEQTVFSTEMAEEISRVALRLNKQAYIHIKIDTGMSRLGFFPSEQAALDILKISRLPKVVIKGVYTHFAVADEGDKLFTEQQYAKYVDFTAKLKYIGLEKFSTHVSNSGAIYNFPGLEADFVRCGILLYGLMPAQKLVDPSFKPVMSLKAHVSMVKEIDGGVSVGYGRTYFTNGKTKVATIPVGYADGYSHSLGNVGRVLIKGKFAPIIGNICMDQFMVNITGIRGVNAEEEVVLFGAQGNQEITVRELANLQNTINYEIVCAIGKRVPRVYVG